MFTARSIVDFVADVWRDVRRLLLVLWLCRVSTASALLALVLSFLPQVQDLYTELTYYQNPTTADYINTFKFWFTFYGLSFLWAFIVHYCARTVLSFESWPLSRSDEAAYAYWIEAVPRYLGWTCIIAIFIGQVNALRNLQIDDQFLISSAQNHYILPLIFVLGGLILVQTITRRLGCSAFILSGIAILYWLAAASDLYFKTRLAEHYRMQVLHNLALPLVTILWGVVFYTFVAKRRALLCFLSRALPASHRFMLRRTRALSEFLPIQVRPNHTQQLKANSPKFFPFRKLGLFRFEAPSENVRGLMLGLFALTLVMIIWALFALNSPDQPPFEIGRALLLPVLLSIWVPLLTTVTFLSNQLRFPFLTVFIICGIALSWGFGDNHDVELTSVIQKKDTQKISDQLSSPVQGSQKLALKKALEIWMDHHNCKETPRACPPPILIAASGGASRSAFFVATVLGELHDNPSLFWPKQLPNSERPKTAQDVAKHIFAISSVSGGSLGSAAYAASLKSSSSSLYGTTPCKRQPLRQDGLLFSVPTASKDKVYFQPNWKNCLQAVTAGDFLSPAMISFAFRDNLALSSLIGLLTQTDRAKSLERAWHERFQHLTERPHLLEPLLSYVPNEERWLPLLLLNSTSVSTGKRVIATPLEPSYNIRDKIQFAPYLASADQSQSSASPIVSIFTDSLDLHELLAHKIDDDQVAAENWDSEQSQEAIPDISISKAISLSARFPLISPHGNLRNIQGRIIDRVVDGGYFDNSGMLTTLELAKAIKTLSNNALKPILIQISNHPVTLKESPEHLQSTEKFRCPEHSFVNHNPPPEEHQFLPELTSVTSALLNARVARGSHAIALAGIDGQDRFVHFQVAGIKDELGSSKRLSMSWWLSKSVQNALNNQMKWKRDDRQSENLTLNQKLNPAFCAIRKFRKAQLNHWKHRVKPQKLKEENAIARGQTEGKSDREDRVSPSEVDGSFTGSIKQKSIKQK
ncbi:MAG: hypothetical protein ACRBBJ_10410 [Rhodomicrobiaceae bacterium]